MSTGMQLFLSVAIPTVACLAHAAINRDTDSITGGLIFLPIVAAVIVAVAALGVVVLALLLALATGAAYAVDRLRSAA